MKKYVRDSATPNKKLKRDNCTQACFKDNRVEATAQTRLINTINNSSCVLNMRSLQLMADNKMLRESKKLNTVQFMGKRKDKEVKKDSEKNISIEKDVNLYQPQQQDFGNVPYLGGSLFNMNLSQPFQQGFANMSYFGGGSQFNQSMMQPQQGFGNAPYLGGGSQFNQSMMQPQQGFGNAPYLGGGSQFNQSMMQPQQGFGNVPYFGGGSQFNQSMMQPQQGFGNAPYLGGGSQFNQSMMQPQQDFGNVPYLGGGSQFNQSMMQPQQDFGNAPYLGDDSQFNQNIKLPQPKISYEMLLEYNRNKNAELRQMLNRYLSVCVKDKEVGNTGELKLPKTTLSKYKPLATNTLTIYHDYGGKRYTIEITKKVDSDKVTFRIIDII